jgi:hypothetical protein
MLPNLENKKYTTKLIYCTTCRNRFEHITKTLPENLKNHSNYTNVRFLLLNYNSQDDLDSWVKKNLISYTRTGQLLYFHEKNAPRFWMSHAKNMSRKLANSEWTCNLDADNFVSTKYTNYLLKLEKGTFSSRMVRGDRITVENKIFIKIGGYDERIKNYGCEDTNLHNRLLRISKRIFPRFFENIINHSWELRESANLPGIGIKKGYSIGKLITQKSPIIVNTGISWGAGEVIKNWNQKILIT